MSWEDVEAAVPQAKAIAFDGCHKIYVLLDDEQVELFTALGYRQNSTEGGSRLYTLVEITTGEMLVKLHEWFDRSCFLKFVYAVKTVDDDPNDGFTALISQGEYEDEEDE